MGSLTFYPSLILVIVALVIPQGHADRVAHPGDPYHTFLPQEQFQKRTLPANDFTPFKKTGSSKRRQAKGKSPKSKEEIVCLLKSIDVKPQDAETAADAFVRALDALGLDELYFNTVSLLHFLAQTATESAGFHKLVQDHDPSLKPDKIGYGYIQVTGSSNRKEAAECMKEADPGSEKGVTENPLVTIGRVPYLAALASFCWWKNNIIENPHNDLAKSPDPVASEKLTHLINAGDIRKPVTNGKRNIEERKGTFKRLLAVERERKCQPTN